MEKSNEENAASEAIRKIHRMVSEIKREKEASVEYMKVYEREQMIREEGREKGREEGRKEGRKEGHQEGIEQGREQNLRECIEKMAQNGMTAEEIVRILEVDRDMVQEYF